ncbi:hypothetical protein [Thalassotalea agarivorans]|uniref:Uncharacterized protein n=1 Tax=Thalassotalea agarivorans TaxID=349064 RepID=A0A1I0AN62_THASX|nr:hypothetical protein [Thalassotalea agarivorans]SES94846.1 hypothetical protein SAMN05660429_00740 [Thalassotalea agarivorans]
MKNILLIVVVIALTSYFINKARESSEQESEQAIANNDKLLLEEKNRLALAIKKFTQQGSTHAALAQQILQNQQFNQSPELMQKPLAANIEDERNQLAFKISTIDVHVLHCSNNFCMLSVDNKDKQVARSALSEYRLFDATVSQEYRAIFVF